MRLLLGLLACSVLAAAPACTTKKVYVNNGAAAGPEQQDEDAGAAEDTPASNPVALEIGEITAGKDVPFLIPKGALGFNITVEGSVADFDPDAPHGIERVVDPAGNVIHD